MWSPDIIFYGLAVPVVTAISAVYYQQGRKALEEWADRNRFRILRATWVFMPMPWQPFYWRSRQGVLFFISICDYDNTVRTGYAFCQTATLFSPAKTEVKWDRY